MIILVLNKWRSKSLEIPLFQDFHCLKIFREKPNPPLNSIITFSVATECRCRNLATWNLSSKRLSSTIFTWSILEYLDPYIPLCFNNPNIKDVNENQRFSRTAKPFLEEKASNKIFNWTENKNKQTIREDKCIKSFINILLTKGLKLLQAEKLQCFENKECCIKWWNMKMTIFLLI